MTIGMIGGGRPLRTCDVCAQTDDHPRHVVNNVLGTEQSRHLDCCAARGCPGGSCPKTLTLTGAVRGSDLLTELTKIGGQL